MAALVFLDVETTGLYGNRDKIIEIFMLKVGTDGSVVDMETLINPEQTLPERIQTITGLRDADLKDAPIEAEAAPKIREFINDHTIVAHNLRFDKQFLDAMFARQKLPPLSRDGIDTLAMSRRLFPKLCVYLDGRSSNTLQNLKAHFGIDGFFAESHRARSDVLALVQIYRFFTEIETGVYPWEFPTEATAGCPVCGAAMKVAAEGLCCPKYPYCPGRSSPS